MIHGTRDQIPVDHVQDMKYLHEVLFLWPYVADLAYPRPGLRVGMTRKRLTCVPGVTYFMLPGMSTSTSWMWLLQLVAMTVGLLERSFPRRRANEMVMPLALSSKEPCAFLEEKEG